MSVYSTYQLEMKESYYGFDQLMSFYFSLFGIFTFCPTAR